MEKADISTLEKPDISILVLQSDLSFGYLSAERKSPVKIPIPLSQQSDPRRVQHGSSRHAETYSCANRLTSCDFAHIVKKTFADV